MSCLSTRAVPYTVTAVPPQMPVAHASGVEREYSDGLRLYVCLSVHSAMLLLRCFTII